MRTLGEAYDRFLGLMGALPGVIIALLALGVGAQVVARNLDLGGFFWMLDAVEYGLLVLTMAGAAYVLSIGRHVTVDLVVDMLPARARNVLQVAIEAITLAVSLIIVYYGIAATLLAYAEDSTLYKSIEIKEWMPMAVVPGGMALFAVESLRRLVRSIAGWRAGRTAAAKTYEGL